LLGRGDWQEKAAKALDRSASVIYRTEVMTWPEGNLHPVKWLEGVLDYLDAADVAVVWVEEAGLWLDQWTLVGFILGRCPGKLVFGMVPSVDHPMESGLRYLVAAHGGPRIWDSLDDVLAVARQELRKARHR
jgi:hypothetical protein